MSLWNNTSTTKITWKYWSWIKEFNITKKYFQAIAFSMKKVFFLKTCSIKKFNNVICLEISHLDNRNLLALSFTKWKALMSSELKKITRDLKMSLCVWDESQNFSRSYEERCRICSEWNKKQYTYHLLKSSL